MEPAGRAHAPMRGHHDRQIALLPPWDQQAAEPALQGANTLEANAGYAHYALGVGVVNAVVLRIRPIAIVVKHPLTVQNKIKTPVPAPIALKPNPNIWLVFQPVRAKYLVCRKRIAHQHVVPRHQFGPRIYDDIFSRPHMVQRALAIQ